MNLNREIKTDIPEYDDKDIVMTQNDKKDLENIPRKRIRAKFTIEELFEGFTGENPVKGEVRFGEPVGRERWWEYWE
jgi:hypothetical protein